MGLDWTSNQTWGYGGTAFPTIPIQYTSAASATIPMQMYPAMVALPAPEPEQKDNSALGWLRGQVDEYCELARAA
jgi:hypothetical protein